MAELVLVADGAYPQADYSFLPPGVVAWGGYVGGDTPHDWTAAEVAHLEATGRTWLGIWTAPTGRAMTSDDATSCCDGMVAGLRALKRDPALPVILDVEYSTWAADPHLTTQSAQSWCVKMRSFGYPLALWYGPGGSVATWRALWTGTRPDALPAGCSGVQFDHALAGDRYDISVFDPTILEVAMTHPLAWTPDDDAHVMGLLTRVLNTGTAQGQSDWAHTSAADLAELQALINDANRITGALANVDAHVSSVLAAVQALPPDATPDAIAAALLPILPSKDAQTLLVALGAAITKGAS